MTGNNPRKWDKTRVITQVGDHGKYLVRDDGSRRITLWNRQFLRRYTGYEVLHGGLEGVNRPVSGDTLPRQHLATRPDGTPARGWEGRKREETSRQPPDLGGAPWVSSRPMGL
jgi:hypothetical protein